jgi:molybdopterin-guanine dinucleotide biosynthesis protein A
MIPAHDITGLVLAGGRSSRMSRPDGAQVDKGLLLLAGQPLIAHAVAHLQGQVHQILISANRNVEQYARYGGVIPDSPRFPAYSGPLAGLAAALEVSDTPWLVVVPVDVIALPANFVRRLANAASRSANGLVYAKSGGHEHPLCAMMRTSLCDPVQSFLEKGGRRVRDFMAQQGALAVTFADAPASFVNINTPEDLCRAHPTTPQGAPGAG